MKQADKCRAVNCLRTADSMDAVEELTWTYSQRVLRQFTALRETDAFAPGTKAIRYFQTRRKYIHVGSSAASMPQTVWKYLMALMPSFLTLSRGS